MTGGCNTGGEGELFLVKITAGDKKSRGQLFSIINLSDDKYTGTCVMWSFSWRYNRRFKDKTKVFILILLPFEERIF